MKVILVLTDFSPAADRALTQAVTLARSFGSRIELFHKVVYPAPIPPTELLDRLDDAAKFEYVVSETVERPEREAKEELERRAASLRQSGVAVTTHLERSGDVYDLVERAIETTKPDVVVMGTHGRSGVRRWLLGSLAEKILRHVSVNVLTLHEDSPIAGGPSGGLGEVLVPTDFSECSRRAIDTAFRLTKEAGGTVSLVHVLEPQPLPWAEGQETLLVEPDEALRARLETALEAELHGREGSVVVAEGRIAPEIERVARERGAALIVIGTHGRTGLAHAVIGSVAEKMARSSRLPVLSVR